MTLLAGPTRVLRAGSAGVLTSDLLDLLTEHEEHWVADYRDLMATLAPYHDCARRLGVIPADVFDVVASGAPTKLRDIVRTFGRRTDIGPDNFGFAVVDGADGPEYHSRL